MQNSKQVLDDQENVACYVKGKRVLTTDQSLQKAKSMVLSAKNSGRKGVIEPLSPMKKRLTPIKPPRRPFDSPEGDWDNVLLSIKEEICED